MAFAASMLRETNTGSYKSGIVLQFYGDRPRYALRPFNPFICTCSSFIH